MGLGKLFRYFTVTRWAYVRALAEMYEYKREYKLARHRVAELEVKGEQSERINEGLQNEVEQERAAKVVFRDENKKLAAVAARDLKRVEAETTVHADVVKVPKPVNVAQDMQGY